MSNERAGQDHERTGRLTGAAGEALVRAGIDALRRGDGAAARAAFEQVIAEAPGTLPPWLALAQACRLSGDVAAETRALDALLKAEPRHLAGLLLMGDRKERDGDDRAANTFYTAALNQAAVMREIPPSLRPLLDRAQAARAEMSARFAEHFTSAMSGQLSPRVAASVDLLLGKTQLYLQEPGMFYFPGLPQRAFFDRAEFGWAAAVEAAVPAIRTELEAAAGSGFTPYVVGGSDRPRPNNPLLDDPNWGALYLWQSGSPVAENAASFPAAMAALEQVPLPQIPGRSPMALFSRLAPGTHIQPHNGLLNTRLICHLPIIVPPGCGLRVGAETREWREGELVVFDDSIEHEAWNRGTAMRTVLLFEVWRPELGDEEKAELTRLFQAIDAYGPAMIDQG